MAKEVVRRKDERQEYQRDTIDSVRNEEADNYQFPPVPDNDNEPSYPSSYTNIKNARTTRSSRPTPKPKKKPKKLPKPTPKAESRNVVLAWRNFAFVAAVTSIIYPIQIFFSIVNLVGFAALVGVQSNWLASAVDFGTFGSVSDAGGGLMIVGMSGALLCGFVGFLGASVIFTAIDKSILHGWSLLILALCFVTLLLPIISLAPVMLFWYRYLAFAK